jgi:hypothetical protein
MAKPLLNAGQGGTVSAEQSLITLESTRPAWKSHANGGGESISVKLDDGRHRPDSQAQGPARRHSRPD